MARYSAQFTVDKDEMDQFRAICDNLGIRPSQIIEQTIKDFNAYYEGTGFKLPDPIARNL